MSVKVNHYDFPEVLLSELEELSSMEIKSLCDEIKKLDYDEFSSLFSNDIRSGLYEQHISSIFKKIKLTLYRGERDSTWVYSSSAERSELRPEVLRTAQACLFSIIFGVDWYKKGMAFKINGREYIMGDDPIVISQHYGVPTNYIDFTLDPKIAFFFACNGSGKSSCECNRGRIYAYETTLYDIIYGSVAESVIQYSLLSGPYNQKGFLLKDSIFHDSESLKSYTFNHNFEFSERICNDFEFGKKLMGSNHDDILEHVSKGLLTILDCICINTTYSDRELNNVCYFFKNFIDNSTLFIEFLSMGSLPGRYYNGTIEQLFETFKNCTASLNSLYDFLSLSKFERLLFDKILHCMGFYLNGSDTNLM